MVATCEWCGETFQGRRRQARYCSDSCRKAAWRDRVSAAPEAAQEPVGAPGVHLVGPLPSAVATGPVEGLGALSAWLAETLDGLQGPGRAVHGPRLAAALTAALMARARLQRRASAPAQPAAPSRLDQMRQARADIDRKMGYT